MKHQDRVPSMNPGNSTEAADVAFKLKRYLAQKVLPIHLIGPTTALLDLTSEASQDELVAVMESLLDPSIQPPGTDAETEYDYFRVYLKLLIRSLERNGVYIGESLTELYSNLIMKTHALPQHISMTGPTDTPMSTVRYFYKQTSTDYIVLHEQPNVIAANGGTGHRTWEAALALTDYILTLTAPMRATLDRVQSVVELGAGTGLVGLVASRVLPHAHTVALTDGDDSVVQNLESNITLNPPASGRSVVASKFLWAEDKATPTDLVLAADVTYDGSVIPYLVTALDEFLSLPNPPAAVLVAATIRSEETFAVFRHECQQKGIRMVEERSYKQPIESNWFWISPASASVLVYSLWK